MLSNIATLAYRYYQMLPLSHMCINILPPAYISTVKYCHYRTCALKNNRICQASNIVTLADPYSYTTRGTPFSSRNTVYLVPGKPDTFDNSAQVCTTCIVHPVYKALRYKPRLWYYLDLHHSLHHACCTMLTCATQNTVLIQKQWKTLTHPRENWLRRITNSDPLLVYYALYNSSHPVWTLRLAYSTHLHGPPRGRKQAQALAPC